MRLQLAAASSTLLFLASQSLLTTLAQAQAIVKRDAPLEVAREATVFNGEKVPPMVELSGETLHKQIGKGFWIVEGFSPYCGHCQSLAPKLQTIYEFYQTSNPTPGFPSDETFSEYYSLQFGQLDCIAFGTACVGIKVNSFPTLIFLENDKEVKRLQGDRSLQEISNFIEQCLEIIKLGSRPKGGVEVPKAGAKEFSNPQTHPPISERKASGDRVPKSKQEKKLPNENGKAVDMRAESFQRYVTKTLDGWFIMFHAPWCPHCQAMAPTWEAVAREMKGKMNVGKVNCEIEKRICKDVHVPGYPTIVYLKGGERIEYTGLRGIGDLISWADKAIDASKGVEEVTLEQFKALEKEEEVIFVYLYDHATTSEDFMALERLPLSLIGHAKLVKTSDPALAAHFKVTTWPRLLVSRSGKTTIYDYLAPQAMRDVKRVQEWMRSVWLPLVPELTAANAHDITAGKYTVLGILSRERQDQFEVAKKEMKNAALEWIEKQNQAFIMERQELRYSKQLRIEEAEDRNDQGALRWAKQIRIDMNEVERIEVGFAWVDGIFWERWIRSTFGISTTARNNGDPGSNERVVIYDHNRRRYWDVTTTGNPIMASRTSILETLPKVVANPPKLTPKPAGPALSHRWFQVRSFVRRHPIFCGIAAAVGTLGGLLSWARSRRRKSFKGRGRSRTEGRIALGEKDVPAGNGNGNGPSGKVD